MMGIVKKYQSGKIYAEFDTANTSTKPDITIHTTHACIYLRQLYFFQKKEEKVKIRRIYSIKVENTT